MSSDRDRVIAAGALSSKYRSIVTQYSSYRSPYYNGDLSLPKPKKSRQGGCGNYFCWAVLRSCFHYIFCPSRRILGGKLKKKTNKMTQVWSLVTDQLVQQSNTIQQNIRIKLLFLPDNNETLDSAWLNECEVSCHWQSTRISQCCHLLSDVQERNQLLEENIYFKCVLCKHQKAVT